MKNKRETDKQNKEAHIAQKNAAKERRRNLTTPIEERKEQNRQELPNILIVCVGKNTERTYFEKFRQPTIEIEIVPMPYDPKTMVENIINPNISGHKFIHDIHKYQQIWVVFDKDSFQDDNFDNAIFLAEKNNINVAYSNQAFEYWLILHFEAHQGGAMSRKDYDSKINGYIKPFGAKYDGKDSKIIDDKFFNILMSLEPNNDKKLRKVDLAIDRAKKIDNQNDPSSPSKNESSTTVYKLVEKLLNY